MSPYSLETNKLRKLAVTISLIINAFIMHDANAATSTINCAPAPTSTLLVDVKSLGAKGDGVTNDTAHIQAAIDQVAGSGGTVSIPDGTYLIDAVTSLKLKSNMTLSLSGNAYLKAIPTNHDNYSILLIEDVSNVNVIGGTLQGERNNHLGTSGEYGMGVEILNSKAITLQGITSRDNWGDGFYIGQHSANINICSVQANNNRRHGAAVTSVNGLIINNSQFIDSNGVAYSSGLDLEPNAGLTINNVQILNSEFQNNFASGIQSSFPSLADAAISVTSNVLIKGNNVHNNGAVGTYSAAISLSSQKGVLVLNNIVSNNVQDGILLDNNSTRNNLTGNTVTGSGYNNNISNGTAGFGILLQNGSNLNIITHNVVNGNKTAGILDQVSVANQPPVNKIVTNTLN
jgi:parallel beta-helix repeat protein